MGCNPIHHSVDSRCGLSAMKGSAADLREPGGVVDFLRAQSLGAFVDSCLTTTQTPSDKGTRPENLVVIQSSATVGEALQARPSLCSNEQVLALFLCQP